MSVPREIAFLANEALFRLSGPELRAFGLCRKALHRVFTHDAKPRPATVERLRRAVEFGRQQAAAAQAVEIEQAEAAEAARLRALGPACAVVPFPRRRPQRQPWGPTNGAA